MGKGEGMIASFADGGGYAVNAKALRNFARIADSVGQSVESLSPQIRAALALGVAGGLDIGVSIGRAEHAWGTRLTQLAGEATGIGSNLNANAASYDQAESGVLSSIDAVNHGGRVQL